MSDHGAGPRSIANPEIDITVVGGGATGVELAGTLAELRNFALRAVYPNIDRSMFHVRLIEMGAGPVEQAREPPSVGIDIRQSRKLRLPAGTAMVDDQLARRQPRDLFAEVVPLGERAVTLGGGKSF